MNKIETIQALTEANISVLDWEQEIVTRVSDLYARGYLTCKMEHLFNHLRSNDEEFREEMISFCDYTIWGKQ